MQNVESVWRETRKVLVRERERVSERVRERERERERVRTSKFCTFEKSRGV